MKIAVIGTGVYSAALTYLFQKQKENDIYLWTEQEKLVSTFQKTRKFDFLSKKIKYDSNVFLSNSYEETLKDASVIFILVGSKYYKATLEQIKPYYKKNVPIFVGTKGMNLESGEFFSDMTRKYLKCNSYSFFAGPTFAKDLIEEYPTFFTVAGSNKIGYKKLQSIFPKSVVTEYIEDLYGLEILATLKNIYAIGSGILAGQRVTDGVYYAYTSTITKEANRIIKKVYGDTNTLWTYGGIGDLLMTTNCKSSRNYTFGKMIGMQSSEDEIEKYQKETTIEGYENLKNIPNLLEKWKLNDSTIMKIYNIVFQDENPSSLYEIKVEPEEDIF